MKRAVALLFFLLAGINYAANAQCVPDPLSATLLSPDSIQNFDTAYVGLPYSQVLTITAPTDTIIAGLPATVDSIIATSVTGLPGSISFQCHNSGCVTIGGSKGCILFSGIPSVSDTGTHDLVMESMIYGKVFGSPASLPYVHTPYNIVVKILTDINESTSLFEPTGVHYNLSGSLVMYFNGNMPKDLSVEVYDIIGKVVYSEKLGQNTSRNAIALRTGSLKTGMYLVTCKFQNGRKVLKFMAE
ncbi:MAG: T9SS type A sorting domain-containing protein [Bacteroidetes bacterium]|nr:T9SS type A sorting domain-containing protein [Bacteroidota bacterium]MBU1720582.1 T9SS type A sorting domain-containing protein [Bacteroidota bacterium]